jgi:lipopolysaccharide transport protein LptA
MRWQKPARLAIAIFVVAFAVVVALALRRGKQMPPTNDPTISKVDPSAVFQTSGKIDEQRHKGGKLLWSVKAGGGQTTHADGRTKLLGGVEVKVPRGNGIFTVASEEAELLPKDDVLQTATFTTDVRLTTEDGLLVTTPEAHYSDSDGIVRIPGPVEFTKGRLKGSGVGATYDSNTEVFWLLNKAHIGVAPDETGGGRLEADARTAGMARAEHYIRLTGEARIDADGRIVRADEIVIKLTEDDSRVKVVEQRGNSRIDGGAGGPQSMAANDIDLTYGEDGRTLQSAKLMENSVVQLPGDGLTAGRRVAGRNIDIALGPDGQTVTNLTATEPVQVDLPPDGETPARRITSQTLVAGGTPAGGLQEATFAGNVEYHETRAARPKVAAVNRTAKSLRLIVKTGPGFGAIEEADFRGNFTFTDGAQMHAEAPHAIYHVKQDRIDLAPSDDPGPAPMVSDGKVEVQARTIAFTISGKKLTAETSVRSSMQPQKKGPGAEQAKLPSVLRADETVFVTSNRLEYDSDASLAVYRGEATLWQGSDTSIRADTITVDDKNGNLKATEKVQTKMIVEHEDSTTKKRKRVEQHGSSEEFEYKDSTRQAVYTKNARVTGPEGDIQAARIVLFLKEKANELERVEAYEKVTLKEGVRLVQGSKMVYTAADDRYVITGPPVLIVEEKPKCGEMLAQTATYERARNRMLADGADANTVSAPCTGKRLH